MTGGAQVVARRARAAVVRRRVKLYLVPYRADDGILMALRAPGGVEERPQPRLGCEVRGEDRLPPQEQRVLVGTQERHRTARRGPRGEHGPVEQQAGAGGCVYGAGCSNGEQECEGSPRAAAVGHDVLPLVAAVHHDGRGLESGRKRTLGRRAWVTCIGPFRRAVAGRFVNRRDYGSRRGRVAVTETTEPRAAPNLGHTSSGRAPAASQSATCAAG